MQHATRYLAAIIVTALPGPAQESASRVEGNEEVRRQLQPVLRKIYDSAGSPVLLLIKSGLPGVKDSQCAEVMGFTVDRQLSRIVASAWVPSGKYSAEYYLQAGHLLHIYETLTFYADAAPARAWKTFLKVPAWERRIYFKDDAAAYTETVGSGAPPSTDPPQILSTVHNLVALFERRTPAR